MKFEKIAFAILIICICLLAAVQAAIFAEPLKNVLQSGKEVQGTILAREEYLYEHGYIVINIIGEHDKKVSVLVNGDEVASFEDSSVKIRVINGDIVELNNHNEDSRLKACVSYKSPNISERCLSGVFDLKKGVNRLYKIKMTQE